MSWIKQNENFYTHSDAPFSLQYVGGVWYVVDNRDQSKAIPFSDIFNNPAYAIDLSAADVLVKSLTSSTTVAAGTVVSGTHIRGEGANTPSTPAHSFKTEINSGMYRESAGVIAFSVLGNKVGAIGAGYGGFTGNIIQVVQGSSGTRFNSTSTSFITFSDGVSITPKYTNSKFLIIYVFSSNASGNMANDFARKIGSGSIVQNISGKTQGISSLTNATVWNINTLIYLDSPTLTDLSPITYYLSSKVSINTMTSMNMGSGVEFSPFIIAEVQQ